MGAVPPRLPVRLLLRRGAYKGNVSADTTFTELQTELKEVYAVGRYGLTPEWGDGHDTGIYTFKMLRRAAGLA